jgi:nucleoid DNA-binding protein
VVGIITTALKQGEEVRMLASGTFGVSLRGKRQSHNSQTGAAVTITVSKAAKFSAGETLMPWALANVGAHRSTSASR